VHLHGIQPSQLSLTSITPEQFLKMQTRNDIWALTVVQQPDTYLHIEPPPIISQVLDEFQDVFA
jgi:hypothetical protein